MAKCLNIEWSEEMDKILFLATFYISDFVRTKSFEKNIVE